MIKRGKTIKAPPVFISLLISMLSLFSTIAPARAQTNSDPIGEGIQLIQQGQLRAAKAQLATARPPYQGEALFLSARIAEFEHNWAQAMSDYRAYLSQNPFSVHRLEARAAFALLRVYKDDPLLGDYVNLLQLRDKNAVSQMQQFSARLYASKPNQPLAIRGQLLTAHSLLELNQQPKQALTLYRSIAKATIDMEADWHIQALFGAMFSALRNNQIGIALELSTQLQAKLDSNWGNRNSLLARSWQQRLDAMRFMFELQKKKLEPSKLPFLWGIGARLLLDQPVGSGKNFSPIWNTLSAHDLEVRSVTLWITQNNDWHWIRADLLRGAHANGYIPMINYWFFGDQINPEYVQANRERYLDEVKTKLIPLLRELPQAYLVLEPEFNKHGIENWEGWDPLMLEVIALIRQQAPQIKIGLGLGDWDQPGSEPSFNSAQQSIEASDFVASMLMLSSYTERAHTAPDWSPWVRALRLGERLQKRFNKPWMLAYLSIASQPDWEVQQANELQKLKFYLPMLQTLDLFALNWFSLTDEPEQQGWFSDAEKSFGLLDAHYHPKQALATYIQLTTPHATALRPPDVTLFSVADITDTAFTAMQIKAEFTHWSRWEIMISHEDNIWVSRGAGDALSLDWYGQMLPLWASSGPLAVILKLDGYVVKEIETSWKGLQDARVNINEAIKLDTWHTWQYPLVNQIDAAQFGQPKSGAIEIVTSGITPDQLDSLYIGVIDSHGYYQTLSAAGYAYSNDTTTAIYLPLSDLRQNWVKYENGTPRWRNTSTGDIAVVLQNNSPFSLSFRVDSLQLLAKQYSAP
ncbi:hypothetical protein [Vibrio sp. 10N.261.51.F12]|uniref:hypothetical protein n=1 Tax=Vibrio sp. 10N.261.51.F12 TaxID=3229679 RepID=UPI0035510DE2